MNALGAQEVHFPALLPREPYETSNRWTEYGDNIFRLQDRKGADYLLGPTHEEMFTLLVKDSYSSYKDLPVSLYQIQTKYRDEPRPRAGILRGREFVMKDSYSFDVSDEGLQESYDAHRDAYIRIFDRFGFDYVIVAAMSGAMGGSASEEFLASAENGEDTYVRCTNCDYAANVEAVRVRPPAADRVRRSAGRARRGHPGHPDDRHACRRICNAAFPRNDRAMARRRHAEECHRHGRAARRHARTTGHWRPRRPRGRREAVAGTGRARRGDRVHRSRLCGEPRATQGIHRSGGVGGEERVRYPLPGRPASRRRNALGHRR